LVGQSTFLRKVHGQEEEEEEEGKGKRRSIHTNGENGLGQRGASGIERERGGCDPGEGSVEE